MAIDDTKNKPQPRAAAGDFPPPTSRGDIPDPWQHLGMSNQTRRYIIQGMNAQQFVGRDGKMTTFVKYVVASRMDDNDAGKGYDAFSVFLTPELALDAYTNLMHWQGPGLYEVKVRTSTSGGKEKTVWESVPKKVQGSA